MNTTQVHAEERQIIGWYALRWTSLTDRLKASKYLEAASRPMNAVRSQAMPRQGSHNHADEASITEEKKLQNAVADTHNILIQASSVWPVNLFPDCIIVDRQKLTIVHKKFFNLAQTVSVPLENVKNIEAYIGPFFGSLTITSDLFINNTQTIKFLLSRDAKAIQKLVQGAVTAISHDIDLSKIETTQLKHLLSQLGEGHTDLLEE